jgi:hypothetical protein
MLYYSHSTRNSWGTNQALASASLYLPPIKNIFSSAKQTEQKLRKPKFISIEMDGKPHPMLAPPTTPQGNRDHFDEKS